MNVPYAYMDIHEVTEDLPIFERLEPDEKKIIIDTYIKILNSKSRTKVMRLLQLIKAKYSQALEGGTVYHKIIQDQYRSIINILEYHLDQRPMTDWKY